MTGYILNKEQRAKGLITWEDGTNLYIEDTKPPTILGEIIKHRRVAVFGIHASIVEIQRTANDYLIQEGR
jgi:hypothetical protein